MAFWRIDLGGRGPGYALRDILARAPAPVTKARVIAHIAPDIVVVSGLDYDHGHAALYAFRNLIAAKGHVLPYIFALPSNSGLRLQLNDNSVTTDHVQGYGHFTGARGLALLSRFPVDNLSVRDFTQMLWRDLPRATLPDVAPDWLDHQRLSSTGHWDIPLALGHDQTINLLIYQAGPPVFDGDLFANKDRNHDETAFWSAYLNNDLPEPAPSGAFVIMGGSNLDPFDGDGRHEAIRALLAHPRLQDPEPISDGARMAGDDAKNRAHRGPPELDTVHWPQENGPGNLRVSYILPSVELRTIDAGVFWPEATTPEAELLGDPNTPVTPHRLIWVDLDRTSIPAQQVP